MVFKNHPMRRPKPLSEASMLSAEARIPELAAQAVRKAHARALATAGRVLMKAADGKLVERHASGQVARPARPEESRPLRYATRAAPAPGAHVTARNPTRVE